MATGVQSGQFVDRVKETFQAVLEYHLRGYGVSAALREIVTKDLLTCLEHDLTKGQCRTLSSYVWNSGMESIAGKPGTPLLHTPPGAAVAPAAQPAAAVSAGVPRGTCPKCKKIYEKCSCSFGLPNGK